MNCCVLEREVESEGAPCKQAAWCRKTPGFFTSCGALLLSVLSNGAVELIPELNSSSCCFLPMSVISAAFVFKRDLHA